MATNENNNGYFHQGNAAAGIPVFNPYYPGYGAAFANPYGQWPGYGNPYMPQFPAPSMPQFPGMAPGFFTSPPGFQTPPVQ